jgi:hypothetical protein
MNGHAIGSVDDLHHFLSDWPIGRPVTVALLRGTDEVRLEVVPAEAYSP